MPNHKSISSNYTRILSTIGIILSSYALYVEHRMSHPPGGDDDGVEEFVALCDIDAIGASCSNVFTLPEGRLLSYLSIIPHDHILDVPNAALGLAYYTTIFLLEQTLLRTRRTFDRTTTNDDSGGLVKMTVGLNVAAMSSSVFLASKLLALGELCILCWSTHLINLLLLVYYARILIKGKGGRGGTEKLD